MTHLRDLGSIALSIRLGPAGTNPGERLTCSRYAVAKSQPNRMLPRVGSTRQAKGSTMQIGIATESLSPLMAAGAASVLEVAGFEVGEVNHAVGWAEDAQAGSVLVMGCDNRQECALFQRIREIASQTRTVALASSAALAQPLLRYGASVVLPMTMTKDWLAAGVKAIGAGFIMAPRVALTDWTPSGAAEVTPRLVTDQEIDWLVTLDSGATIRQLADAVGYSERHMKRLLAKTYRKLDGSTKLEALMEASRRGFLDRRRPQDRSRPA